MALSSTAARAADEGSGTFVVVRRDAPVFTSSEPDAKVFRGAPETPYVRWRLVARRGDLVEVESEPPPAVTSELCVPAERALDNFRVRLFVRAADLVPVLTQQFERTYADFTAVRYPPGLPLEPGDAERLGLAPSSIGDAFLEDPFTYQQARRVKQVTGTLNGVKKDLETSCRRCAGARGR